MFGYLIPLLFAASGLALVFGLRGRRIDNHPLCRRCGFDLTGKPESSSRCGECGADLTLTRAIYHGHRKRRRGLIALGSTLLLIVLLVVGVGLWVITKDVSVDRFKPTWWLIREAADTSPGAPIAAWTELSRRAAAGELSQGQTDRLSDLALAIQADQNRTWNVIYGNFVENARFSSTLSDERWQKYARHAPSFTLTVRDKVRRGDVVPSSVAMAGNRVGGASRLVIRVLGLRGTGDLINEPVRRGSGGYSSTQLNAGNAGSFGHQFPIDKKAVTTAPTGPRLVYAEFDVQIREGFDDNSTTVVAWKEKIPAPWQLVEADAQTVEVFDDPSIQKQVERAFVINNLEYYDSKYQSLSLGLTVSGLPVPVAFDIFLRADGKEHRLTSVSITSASTSYGTGGEAKIQANQADVIFRPSTRAARESVTMKRMWNGGFEVKNVPIKRPPPATQPVEIK